MSSSSSKSLNPHAPEYKPISPGISPNPLHHFSLRSLLLENAAASSPPPPPSFFSTQIFTYVGPPPPPPSPFYAANRTSTTTTTTTYYFSQQQQNANAVNNPYPPPARREFGQRRGCRASGRGRGTSRGFMMNDRRQRNMIVCNNNNKNVIWMKKQVKNVAREVVPLKPDENKTTVMIKNIPYHCPRNELIDLLDRFCMMENAKDRIEEGGTSKWVLEESAAYDFFYLPIDFRTQKGRGYAFVNFTNTQTVWKFFNAFHLTHWDSVQWNHWPKKIEIVSAKIQGKEALVNHFEGSIFECETDEYLPVRFDPAKDGSGQPVEVTVVAKRRAIPHGATSTLSNHKTLRRPRLLA